MNKPTLTIGIAAYNEREAIVPLLRDIQKQHLASCRLVEVLVVSDGSTDDTVSRVRSLRFGRVRILQNKTRIGLAKSLNRMLATAKTDIVVTLDADIRIRDTRFIQKLIAPIVAHAADYTSSSIEEEPSTSFFAHTIILSMQAKRAMYRAIGTGNNVYTSYGLARAYSKRLYATLRYPFSAGNDMFVYFYCLNKSYRFSHVPTAIARYTIPHNLHDYSLQSARFFQAKQHMLKVFQPSVVTSAFHIPFSAVLSGLWKSFFVLITHPIHTFVYMLFLAYGYTRSLHTKIADTWTISTSTKKGIIEYP
jgi:glycosyltransferase involved in cell wall biosynthesis